MSSELKRDEIDRRKHRSVGIEIVGGSKYLIHYYDNKIISY